MILILLQLALLLLTAWGWGFWLRKIIGGDRAVGWRSYGWFFFGIAGFMTCILFLHALIYFDLTLQSTSWAGLLIAAAGVFGSLWKSPMRSGVLRHRRRREIVAASALFVLVFGFQSAPLFHAGPENYYGSAHTDQVNYVLLGQFLIEKPFSTSLADIGLHPWLAKPLTLKVFRLGQSVANGYLGVVSLTDAKRSYGTLSVFVISLGALSVFVLARMLAIPRLLAALVGLSWGILPAVTKVQLDGFFSQACVLFVFPVMAAVFYARRGRLERTSLLLMTVYLAYLLCTYTEVYVLGIGLLISMLTLAAWPGTPIWRRLASVFAAIAGSLLLVGGYVRYLFHYVGNQYQVAADPSLLGGLTPMSGTWTGWKEMFFGYESFGDPRVERLTLLAGFAIVFFMVGAFQGRGLPKRLFLLALLAPPAGVLVLLLSAPELPKYAFSKLLDTFTTFWLILAALGLLYLQGLLARRRLLGQILVWTLTSVLALAALAGSWPQWRATCNDEELLAAVDSAGARRCYAEASHDRRAVYIIDEPHNLLCAWLAYAARESNVYVDADQISDLPIPATLYAFRRLPEVSHSLVILDAHGPRSLSEYQGPPTLVVRNPQGTEGGGESTFYWIGPDATLELTDYSAPGGPVRHFQLAFEALAGPANPIPQRTLVLVGPDGTEQKVEFTGSTMSAFNVNVHPGKNIYTLKVTYPTEQTFRIPTDPRDHMVRMQRLALTPSSPLPDGAQEIPEGTH